MKKSLKSRLILLYFLLVMVAMTIVGVFITKEFKEYNILNIREDMDNISNNLVKSNVILAGENFYEEKEELQKQLIAMPISTGYEISIIGPKDYTVIASTNPRFKDQNAFEVLDENVILQSITEKRVEKDIKGGSSRGTYMVKNVAYSERSGKDELRYIVYLRASLDGVEKLAGSVTGIIAKSTVIALLSTIVVGYLLATTITRPINELTSTALEMSKGDFSTRAKVHSNDEIGQLSAMFNYLSGRVETMIKTLDSEKNKLDAIVTNMQNGLVAMDSKGKIIQTNPMFNSLLEIEEENLIGKNYNDVVRNLGENLSIESLAFLANPEKENYKVTALYGKYIRVSSAVFKSQDGRVGGLIGVFQDITTAQMAEELRKEFVANVSHELKTPITSIKGYAQTLLEGAMEDRGTAENFLTVIDQEADRMTMLIQDLLQLSRIDYQKESWNMEKGDINELVLDSMRKMRIYTEEKNHQVTIDIPDEEFIITMDKSKIQQAIINLISNAIKYSPQNGNIYLSTRSVGNYCEICVKDSGIGIPKKEQKRIFDRFYRIEKGRSRIQGGTGLGLSIVKAIVDNHKGEIYVKSELGQGTTFVVRLPVDK